MKTAVTASPVECDFSFPKGTEVVRVVHSLGRLKIYVVALGGTQEVVVDFPDVEAFRVMDERDLSEFWPVCSTPNGWIFEVHERGWLSQELERPGSLIVHMNRDLKEYLITGEDECVSVLSVCTPEIFSSPEAIS